MQYLNGVTSGPQSFSGQIGKELLSYKQQQNAEFEPIEIQFPTNDSAFSTDQQYLYDIATAVSSGHCSLNLSECSPGKLSHARWLTTANRILRLYAKANGRRPVGRPRTRWTDYIEDLGWNRLGLRPSEMMEVMEDREVWRLNLELLPPQPSRKSGQ